MKIGVINTGGTISCLGEPLQPMSAADFAAASRAEVDPVIRQRFPEVELTYVTDLPFSSPGTGTLDSTNVQPTDWCIMARQILSQYEEQDAWILLHGTDSMDFTASALSFLLPTFSKEGTVKAGLSKPVILTGSQVPLFQQDPASGRLGLHFNTDAFQNLCGAVAAAQTGTPEVCVYFDGRLYRGNRTVKTNATEFDAFSSPNFPALAEYGIELSSLHTGVRPPPVNLGVSLDDSHNREAALERLTFIQEHIDRFPVMPLSAFPAAYRTTADGQPASALLATLIDACVATGIKGLILESYGEGNFPSGDPDHPAEGAIYQALARARNQGVVVVAATQVLRGVVTDSSYAAGTWLADVGVIGAEDMTPMAAMAKLGVLLTEAERQGWDRATVEGLTRLDLAGEMMGMSRLDSRLSGRLLPGQALMTPDATARLVNHAAKGPMLVEARSHRVLWQGLEGPDPAAMPGRLRMQDDGNLVFYGRDARALWSTGTAVEAGAPSMLMLTGSAKRGDLRLWVYDYSRNKVTATLFEVDS